MVGLKVTIVLLLLFSWLDLTSAGRKGFEFSLMEPEKLLTIIDRLTMLYYPDIKCSLGIQDVPDREYMIRKNME